MLDNLAVLDVERDQRRQIHGLAPELVMLLVVDQYLKPRTNALVSGIAHPPLILRQFRL